MLDFFRLSPCCAFNVGGSAGGCVGGAWTGRRRHVVHAAYVLHFFPLKKVFLVELHHLPLCAKVNVVDFGLGSSTSNPVSYAFRPRRNRAVINSPMGTCKPSSDASAASSCLSSGEKPRQVVM